MQDREAPSEGTWVWVNFSGSKGMLPEEHEQEDRSSHSSLASRVAVVVRQRRPQPARVHNNGVAGTAPPAAAHREVVEDEAEAGGSLSAGSAEVGAGIAMTGRVGVAPAAAGKISCEDVSCTKTPSYGYETDRRRRRCCSHKLENMVYLKRRKCAEPDCTRLSSYGRGGGAARYCLLHKTPDMVDLVNRRCETLGCNRRPVFAMAGQKARLCSDHRKVNMTDVANHLCLAFRCGLKACWGLAGRRATVCFIHRTEQMQKKGGGGGGGSSRSGSGSSNVSASDEVKPRRVSNKVATQLVVTGGGEADGGGGQSVVAMVKEPHPDDGARHPHQPDARPPAEAMDTDDERFVRCNSVSAGVVRKAEVVEEDPIPATHPSREWMLPLGMMGAQDEVSAAAYASMGRHGGLLARPQYLMMPPGQHLHQHFQHLQAMHLMQQMQSSMLPQSAMHQPAGDSSSMHNNTHRAYADQQLNHGSSSPAINSSLLPHSRLQHQHQHAVGYPHLVPASTVAEPYSFPEYGWGMGMGGGMGGFFSAHQPFGNGRGPMMMDSRLPQQHQQQQQHSRSSTASMQHQHAMYQQQMQQHSMHQMHMQMRAGAMFRPDMANAGPASNGGVHSYSASNSTIDQQLQMHANAMSRQSQGSLSSLSNGQLPSMSEMLHRASESGSSGNSINGSDAGRTDDAP